jgi:hypothetical protein
VPCIPEFTLELQIQKMNPLRAFSAFAAATLFTVSSVPAALVGHFTFDNINNLGQDTSGNGYNATLSNPSGMAQVAGGKSGSAIDFNAANSMLTWNNPSSFFNALFAVGTYTFAVWVKTSDAVTSKGYAWDTGAISILNADRPGEFADAVPLAIVQATNSTVGVPAVYVGPNLYQITANGTSGTGSNTQVNNNNWHHLVATRNASTGQLQLFMDGVLAALSPTNNDPQVSPNVPPTGPEMGGIKLSLGAFREGSGNKFYTGLMDDFQAYNTVLTASEIQYLYNNPGQTLASIPEPSTVLLGLVGGAVLLGLRRRIS